MTPHFSSPKILPLNSWGGFSGRKRLSDSPFVESVWEGTTSHDGVHLTAADGTIDLTLLTRDNRTHLSLSGPTSRARATAFEAGDEVLTIRLRSGVYMPSVMGTKLTDIDRSLPPAGKHKFWLQSSAITTPDFDTVELFIERLVKTDLLRRDIVIEDALANRLSRTSPRTIQRHFVASIGLTMSHVRQIRRAEQARNLLDKDYTLTSIAYEVGYSNQGHMTNAFKYFFGRTPSDLRALMTKSG